MSRNVIPTIHPCYALAELVRRPTRSSRDWHVVLDELANLKGPYGTGKEVAMTIYGLSKIPHFLLDRRNTGQIQSLVDSYVSKSIACMVHEMNESSIAITALAITRFDQILSQSVRSQFGQSLCDLGYRKTALVHWSDPRNLAHTCFAIARIPGIPTGTRASALNGWIASAVLNFPPNRFKVKDIVQLLTAYAVSGANNEKIFAHLEKSILGQLQYFDHISIGAIFNAFGKLDHVVSRSVVSSLIATAAQQINDMNAKSLCGLMRGLRNQKELGSSETIALQQIVTCSLPRVANDVPITLWGQFLKSLSSILATDKSIQRIVEDQVPFLISQLTEINDITAQQIIVNDIVKSLEKMNVDCRSIVDRVVLPSVELKWDKIDSPLVNLLKVVSKYHQASFVQLLVKKLDQRLITESTRVYVLIKLLDVLVESSATRSETLGIVSLVVDRISQLVESDEAEIAHVCLQAWKHLGQIPSSIKSLLVKTNHTSELSEWLLSDESKSFDFTDRVYMMNNLLLEGKVMNIRSNPPGHSLLHDEDLEHKLKQLIDSIDPQFIPCFGPIVWVPIQSTHSPPSILEWTLVGNKLLQDGEQRSSFIVFVPSNNDYLDRDSILEMMKFIANNR